MYQFDEQWNGQTVAELVDWSKTHDLYMGLNFPASDIPKQARDLYAISKSSESAMTALNPVPPPCRPCPSTVRPITTDGPTRV